MNVPQPQPQPQPMTGMQYLANRVGNSDFALAQAIDEGNALKAENAALKAEIEKLKAPADPLKK